MYEIIYVILLKERYAKQVLGPLENEKSEKIFVVSNICINFAKIY